MEWHYLENQFNNATRDSFRLMLTVTNDHYAKLVAQQADADILALLNRTEPVHQAFLNAYSALERLHRAASSHLLGRSGHQIRLSAPLVVSCWHAYFL